MADISQELIIIANGRYGRDIREAIRDALQKVNSGGGGGGGGDLSDYYTKEEIDGKLLLYLPTSAVPNITQGILQEIATAYYDKTAVDNMLSSYVTTTSLNSTLASYCSLAELDATIASYVTFTYLDTTLSSYYTKTQIDTTLGSYYTKSQVDALIGSIDSMPHVVCTQAQYDNMDEHDADTLYFVKGELSVALYLGDLPVNTGGGGGSNSLTGSMGLITSGPTSSVAGSNEEV